MTAGGPVYIAGHTGLVGSAIHRRLVRAAIAPVLTRSHAELDLRDRAAVGAFFAENKPAYVYHAAGRVGGIVANSTQPVEFLSDNARMIVNVIDAAHEHDVRKLLFLGSSCIYPREAPQPIREESLLTGPLEPTNEAYALAKIVGVKLCQAYRRQHGRDFVSVMPTNVYGPGDNFHPEHSHVVPALLRRFHEATIDRAEEVVVWGTGQPRREFIHADDLADACVLAMDRYSDDLPLNIGVGEDLTIAELVETIRRVVGYGGAIRFDTSKPDGTPRKLLDSRRLLELGWRPRIGLEEGLRDTYAWYTAAAAPSRGSIPPAEQPVT